MSAPAIELRGVGLTYPSTPPVAALRDIELVVPAGAFVAVTGPSGSGKSSLLSVLGLLERPSAGAYRLDGIDTGSLDQRGRAGLRATRLGFVFQAFHLLETRTAVANVELGLLYGPSPRSGRRQRALAAVDAVGLTHRRWATPRSMSGGERQRIAIARALVREPTVLLADEPTGNLDSVSTEGVLALLDQVHRAGQTVVVVTHDEAVAARAERRVAMVDGTLTG